MAMLLTFVFLGAALVSAATDAFSWQTVLFAILVLAARPIAFSLVLARTQASLGGRLLIAWFGPRGLNSLLLTILAVAAGVGTHDAELLFGAVSLVVLASTVIHGASVQPGVAWYGRQVDRLELPEETLVTAGSMFSRSDHADDAIPRMTPEELKRRLDVGDPVTILDVRRGAAFDASGITIPTAIRMENDEILSRLAEIPRGAPIALFCA